MSAAIARHGDWVQLEQSNMHLALKIPKMATGGFSCTTMEETQYSLPKPHTEVWEVTKLGVNICVCRNINATMRKHLTTVWELQMDRCLLQPNGTANHPQTPWRCIGADIPPPDWLRQPTLEPMLLPAETPPTRLSDNEHNHASQIHGVPPRDVYIHTPLPSAQFLNLVTCPNNCRCNKDFIPDFLTDNGTCTG